MRAAGGAAPLPPDAADAADDNDNAADGMELQESLAPLYYVYGTTLLYSVAKSDVMMAKGGGNAAADVELEPVEPRGEEEGEEAAVAVDPAEDL